MTFAWKRKKNDILERLPVKWSWQHVMWSQMFGLDAAWTKFGCLVANRMKLRVLEWLRKRRPRNPMCWSRTRSTGRWSTGQFLPLSRPNYVCRDMQSVGCKHSCSTEVWLPWTEMKETFILLLQWWVAVFSYPLACWYKLCRTQIYASISNLRIAIWF